MYIHMYIVYVYIYICIYRYIIAVDPIKIIFVEMYYRAMIAGGLLIFQFAGRHGASLLIEKCWGLD